MHMNQQLPKDPIILLSYINTQLRDHYSSLEDLCQTLSLGPTELQQTLASIGYSYNQENNAFTPL